MITPANKPQGFGFAEFETPDGMIAAVEMLNDIELPALEDGCANKRLLVSMVTIQIRSNLINPGQSRRKDKTLHRRLQITEDDDRCVC